MNKNLTKRIFTSIILLTLMLFSIFFHKYLWLILTIVASIICFFEFSKLTKKIWKKNESFYYLVNIISFLYLIFFTFTSYKIYLFSSKNYIIFVLFVCIFSDIGGYLIGKLIGGKKLTKISPNKTISGSIGSFMFSLVPIVIFLTLYNYTGNFNYKLHNTFAVTIFITLIISLINQTGDLLISYFKRKAKFKDTGSILPGHGGLLDRIDGIIFAVPSFFIIQKIFFNL